MPFVETATHMKLQYHETGQGRPVVFVHGWAMSSKVWAFQQQLEDSFRLIFLDQRGHGQSAHGSSYQVQDYAADLAAFLERLDLTDAVLVSWSMGVQITLQAFSSMRTRLAGLVFVGGSPRYTSADDFPHGKAPVEVKGMGVRLRRDHQKTMGDFFKGMFAEGELEKAQYQRIVHEIVMGAHSPDPEAVRQGLDILATVDLRDVLPGVDVPTLLVHGELDTVCPASASRYMAEHLPKSKLEIAPGCGHAPFMSHPERFNATLREFLAGM